MVRGDAGRLAEIADDIELFTCDVRDQEALEGAFAGAEVVIHLAASNGTENFYKRPELVLDAGVPDLIVASSGAVYQTPSVVPTPETSPLVRPTGPTPRCSYGRSKIATE